MTTRVLVPLPLGPESQARLAAVSPELEIEFRPGAEPEGRAEVVVGGWIPLDRSRLPNLRWYQLSSTGLEHFGDRLEWTRGLVLTNASGGESVLVAEYALAAMLDHAQRGAARRASHARHGWPEPTSPLHARHTLRGSTLTIAGYGSLAREIARLASAFGMRVLVARTEGAPTTGLRFREDGTGDPDREIPERTVPLAQLASIAAEADYLVLALPLTPKTRTTLDRACLDAMRPTAFVVNVGRGGLVDQQALSDALIAGRLAGAALDVVDPEPLPAESPLWELPNVMITPHIAGFVREPVLVSLFAENLERYLAGRELLNVVDLERGY
jgi:phosphoglycerate dehydrogenase-like enzyme